VLCWLPGLTAASQGAGEQADASGLVWQSSGVLAGEQLPENFTPMGYTSDLLL